MKPLWLVAGLCVLSLAGQTAPVSQPARPAHKAPFHLLYSNDTGNIYNCVSPFRQPEAEGLTDGMIRASVDEAADAGADAQLLQPGPNWLPWWPDSRVSPLDEQARWFEAHYQVPPSGAIYDYVRGGGDMVKVFVEAVHARGAAAFLSFRLNDLHTIGDAFDPEPPKGDRVMIFARDYVEHPDRLIGKPGGSPSLRLQNWLNPQVRAHKLAMMREACARYALDGIELDFMRWVAYFPEGTPPAERAAVMTAFVAQVRAMLDETAKDGRYRWLSVRVPATPEAWERLGVDPSAFYAAGADIFNLSNFSTVTQQTALARLRAQLPKATLVLEVTPSVAAWRASPVKGGEPRGWRRVTAAALASTARLARARGADGFSVFNWAYFRPSVKTMKRPGYRQPPFEWLAELAHPAPSEGDASYFFYATAGAKGDFLGREKSLKPGEKTVLEMDMLPLPQGSQGRLRLLVLDKSGRVDPARLPTDVWTVTFNGQALDPVSFDGALDPFAPGEVYGLGEAAQYRSFALPAAWVKNGPNHVEVAYRSGEGSLRLRFVDVWAPSGEKFKKSQ